MRLVMDGIFLFRKLLIEEVEKLNGELEASRRILTALGDENRQYLILEMMKMGDCSGVRAIDIAEHTRLSRPAVSHHQQILKDVGILKSRKEGMKIFYYFDPDMKAMNTLIDMLKLSVEITRTLTDRSIEA